MIEMGISWLSAIERPATGIRTMQDLLARVGGRRDRVGGEDGECCRNTETLVLLVLARQWRTDEPPLELTGHERTPAPTHTACFCLEGV